MTTGSAVRMLAVALGSLLAGCAIGGLSEETANSLYAAPGKYDHLNCNDLVPLRKTLTVREKELRTLIEKTAASQGGGLVNAIAYENDYRQTRASIVLLQQAEADKKCEVVRPSGT